MRGMTMVFPVRAEDVKVVHGHAGTGVQVVCSCGCINMNYPEQSEPTWRCRNCRRVITYDFRTLVEQVMALQKNEVTADAAASAKG
jgi:hypothetical protein